MEIIFLGTSCMVPTKERNHTATLLSYKSENILFDCGENTQRQLKVYGISPTKITKILITHWHSDHVLGLPGLIQTLSANSYNKVLEIYGPIGTKNFFNKILSTYILRGEEIKIKITEIKKNGIFFENKDYSLNAVKLKHNAHPCLAYSFIEKDTRKINTAYTKKFGLVRHPLLGKLQKGKNITYKGKKIKAEKATFLKKGKKITLILDTLLCDSCFEIAKNSDLLICEATYLEKLKDKAKEYKHLTAKQAASIAKKSNVKKLILTHFSPRYKNTADLKKEAQKIFKNVICAKDFTKIKV